MTLPLANPNVNPDDNPICKLDDNQYDNLEKTDESPNDNTNMPI
jgi:hypothetical protein